MTEDRTLGDEVDIAILGKLKHNIVIRTNAFIAKRFYGFSNRFGGNKEKALIWLLENRALEEKKTT